MPDGNPFRSKHVALKK